MPFPCYTLRNGGIQSRGNGGKLNNFPQSHSLAEDGSLSP